MQYKIHTILFFVVTFMVLPDRSLAQDVERKWALGYSRSVLVKPILMTNTISSSTGNGSSAFSFTGELYMPNKLSLQAGYFNADLSYGNGSRLMEGMQLGIKKYFVNSDFFIQPYVLGATHFNWGAINENSFYSGDNNYRVSQWTRNPRVSFVPGVGTEFYLFSSIALVLEYNFRIGLNSSTKIEGTLENGVNYLMKDNGMYHYLGLGFKVTFPFHFSESDVTNLFTIVSEIFYSTLDN